VFALCRGYKARRLASTTGFFALIPLATARCDFWQGLSREKNFRGDLSLALRKFNREAVFALCVPIRHGGELRKSPPGVTERVHRDF